MAIFFTTLSVFFVFGLPIFIVRNPAIKTALPFLIGTALAVLSITGFFTWIGLRRLITLQNEEISIREGTIRLETKSLDYNRLQAHYAWVDGFRFQLTSQKQFKTLVDGNRYRIYYIHYPPTHIILSLEDIL